MQFRNVQIDWPLDINTIRQGSQHNTFGMVRVKADGSPKPHQGWDFYAAEGTSCYAIAEGKIVYADDCGDLGKLIVMTIGDTGFFAAYAHLSHILVDREQTVVLGQHIGNTGCTGNASNMTGRDQHLHFEIRDIPLPGLGLEHRYCPLMLYGVCPLAIPGLREGDDD